MTQEQVTRLSKYLKIDPIVRDFVKDLTPNNVRVKLHRGHDVEQIRVAIQQAVFAIMYDMTHIDVMKEKEAADENSRARDTDI